MKWKLFCYNADSKNLMHSYCSLSMIIIIKLCEYTRTCTVCKVLYIQYVQLLGHINCVYFKVM